MRQPPLVEPTTRLVPDSINRLAQQMEPEKQRKIYERIIYFRKAKKMGENQLYISGTRNKCSDMDVQLRAAGEEQSDQENLNKTTGKKKMQIAPSFDHKAPFPVRC